MAAKKTENRVFNAPAHILINLIKSPNLTASASLTFSSCDDYRMIYTFKHDISLSSWGETITVQLVPVAENATNMYVTSECAMPTQFVDWGKNGENINKIMNYMERSIGYALMNSPQQNVMPAQGGYQQQPVMNQSPAQGFCVNCGAQLLPGAVFCTSCGKKAGA